MSETPTEVRDLLEEFKEIAERYIGKANNMQTRSSLEAKLSELFESFELPEIKLAVISNITNNTLKFVPLNEISKWALKGILSSKSGEE